MKRALTSFWLAVGVVTITAGCTTDSAAPTETVITADRQQGVSSVKVNGDRQDDDHDRSDENANQPTTYAVIGDVPYEPRAGVTALSLMPTLIGSINSDPDVRRAIHIGDIKSGSTMCSDSWFQSISTSFTTFADPLVYTPGDNEWTDCHRANNGGYNPLNRLARIRQLFFANPGRTLGGVQSRVDVQAGYPENVSWKASKVMFGTFHVIGSNNGRAPWFGDRKDTTSLSPLVTKAKPETAIEAVAREAEYVARNAANIRWLERLFGEAKNAQGVVLFLQADMYHPDDRAGGAVFTAHLEFLTRLVALAREFGKPVLIVCGDSHDLRVDVGVPWVSLYGLTPVPNITQLTVDRSIEADIDWLKLRIDPKSASVFSWQQMIVPVP